VNQNLLRGKILGTGRALPPKVVTNDDLAKLVDTSDEWVQSRTGIRERRIADPEVATSDLATEAALKALEKSGIKAEDIDLIIMATSTPDFSAFPATACMVQKNIGAKKAAAFDIETACSGFVYSMVIANQFIATGMYKYCLVIGAEVFSRIIDWTDRNTCVLFGDGAGAAVIGLAEGDEGLLSSTLGADGEGGRFLDVYAGGTRMPVTPEVLEKKLNTIRMDGSEVFKFAVRIMESASVSALGKIGLTAEDIDYLVPHQANIRIVGAAAKRLGLPLDKVAVNLDKYANTSAASVPIALDEALEAGKIKPGDIVVMVGFGAGLTWGAAVLRW
jgi:3-oxoacyl-[acyl-carrier-protein] synthase-3